MNQMQVKQPPNILVTGRLWLGADGARSIGASLVEMVDSSKQEVIIVAYRLTSAAKDFVASVEGALARGCLVKIIRNSSKEPQPFEDQLVERLVRQYTTASVWDFREPNASPEDNIELHAKLVVVDRSVAVVGSANFSKNGMHRNHEIGIRVHGAEARSLAIACEQLIENGQKEGVVFQRK